MPMKTVLEVVDWTGKTYRRVESVPEPLQAGELSWLVRCTVAPVYVPHWPPTGYAADEWALYYRDLHHDADRLL